MATFAEGEVTSLARIFGTTSDIMQLWLSLRAGIITDSDKTAILADVTAFEVIESDNVYIDAGPAGFKGRISPQEKRDLIASGIAALIGWEQGKGPELVRR